MTPLRRQCLHMAVFTLSVVAGLSGIAQGQSSQKSLKDQLVGEWTLVSAKNTSSAGVTRDLFGPDPKGILILEASGRYAQVQVRPDRPQFKAGNRSEGTAEENEAAVRGAYASFGTWSVSEAEKTFTRSIIGSATFPNEERKDTVWTVAFTGDELRLSVPTSSAGGSTELLLHRAQ